MPRRKRDDTMFDAKSEREIARLQIQIRELTEEKNIHHAACVGALGVLASLRQTLHDCDHDHGVILATNSIEAMCVILKREAPPLLPKRPRGERPDGEGT